MTVVVDALFGPDVRAMARPIEPRYELKFGVGKFWTASTARCAARVLLPVPPF